MEKQFKPFIEHLLYMLGAMSSDSYALTHLAHTVYLLLRKQAQRA